jgi:hypothetical protein
MDLFALFGEAAKWLLLLVLTLIGMGVLFPGCVHFFRPDPRYFVPGGTKRLYVRASEGCQVRDHPACRGRNGGEKSLFSRELSHILRRSPERIIPGLDQPGDGRYFINMGTAEEDFDGAEQLVDKEILPPGCPIVYQPGTKPEMDCPMFVATPLGVGYLVDPDDPTIEKRFQVYRQKKGEQALADNAQIRSKEIDGQRLQNSNKQIEKQKRKGVIHYRNKDVSQRTRPPDPDGDTRAIPAALWKWTRIPVFFFRGVVRETAVFILCGLAGTLFMMIFVEGGHYPDLPRLCLKVTGIFLIIQTATVGIALGVRPLVCRLAGMRPAWYAVYDNRPKNFLVAVNEGKTLYCRFPGYNLKPDPFLYASGFALTNVLPLLAGLAVLGWEASQYIVVLSKTLMFLLMAAYFLGMPAWNAKIEGWKHPWQEEGGFWLHHFLPRWSVAWEDKKGSGWLKNVYQKQRPFLIPSFRIVAKLTAFSAKKVNHLRHKAGGFQAAIFL